MWLDQKLFVLSWAAYSQDLVVYFWLFDKLKIRSAALLRVLCEFVNGLSTRWIPPWWILVKALRLLSHFPQMLLHSDGLPFIFSPIYSIQANISLLLINIWPVFAFYDHWRLFVFILKKLDSNLCLKVAHISALVATRHLAILNNL